MSILNRAPYSSNPLERPLSPSPTRDKTSPERLKARNDIEPSMIGADFINDPYLPERLILSSYPFDGSDKYWSDIIADKIDVTVQLASLDPPLDYHLEVKSRRAMGHGSVYLDSIQKKEHLLIRHYLIEVNGETRKFTHFFIPWTDGDLPDSNDFSRLYKSYMKCIQMLPDPVTHVHCAGGIGRTGTFVYTRALVGHLEQGDANAIELLSKLREARSGLVETKNQADFSKKMATEFTKGKLLSLKK